MEKHHIIETIERTNAILDREGLDDEFFKNMGFERLHIPHLKGYVSPINSERVNHVGLARFSQDNADEMIQIVIQEFKKYGKSFSWAVGPDSTPSDLGDRLKNNGFHQMTDIQEAGMVMELSSDNIRESHTSSVKEVTLDELEENLDLIVKSFGSDMNKGSANAILQTMKAVNATKRYNGQIKTYIAYDKETGGKVGFAVMEMDREGKYGILDGSAVLPSFRGRGIYKSMVWKRLEDAKYNGLEFLIIHALEETSAPICEKIGFRKICSISFYGYNIQ
ncbi:MAG: GNAT family N-acetyltransferase [Candidatus Thermoplasmatota archaeon]|jgi:N-acetylglutamate synthase-like GNAT family acetyltransferase|nr:GNAT family N-acetyltransferase [Candidatus Thermoplasmatota archaeon]MCL5789403.1 GNAT family N-acetyltransferase [Candidatus Thermoplasmatota archaeon]